MADYQNDSSDVGGDHSNNTSGMLNSSAMRGLGVSNIGDTKSIVLALQALQEKIRKLEQDRNFHQEQCEAARAAHDQYKRDVEIQLENERRAHRQREQELQEMVSRANAERSRLQGTLEESKTDISSFRNELETLLEKERTAAREREDRLRDEIERSRAEIQKERRAVDQVQHTVEQIKTEKEIVLSTNRRLEGTIKDLIAMNNGLMEKAKKGGIAVNSTNIAMNTRTTTSTTTAGARNYGSGRGAPATSGARRHVDPSATAVGSRNSSVNVSRDSVGTAGGGRPRGRSSSLTGRHYRYASPTHSSELKSCTRCVSHHVMEEGPVRGNTPQRTRANQRSSSNTRTSSSSRHAVKHAAVHSHHTAATAAGGDVFDNEQNEALDEVYEGLVREHRELNAKYKEIIERANAPGSSVTPEVLTATLNSVMAQIDRKAEQMRLLRNTRSELAENGDVAAPSGVGAAGRRGRSPRGTEKVIKKGALVNELRALFAKASH